MAAPIVLRAFLCAAARLVPAPERSAWREKWTGRVRDWRLLADRGEPVGSAAPLCRLALKDAAGQRFGHIRTRHVLRSPTFVPVAIAAALLLLAAVSRGFAVTRWVVSVAADIRAHPAFCGPYDPRGDKVFAYCVPAILAWAVGVALFVMGTKVLNGRGWRYWFFLVAKALAALAVSTLAWIEIGAAVRSFIPHEGWRTLVGLLSVFVFVPATGRAMLWAVADQRRRCPACLRFLIAPVAVGSWASLFEPPATEFLCEKGHGALSVADAETNAQDHWTRLDESWSALFR